MTRNIFLSVATTLNNKSEEAFRISLINDENHVLFDELIKTQIEPLTAELRDQDCTSKDFHEADCFKDLYSRLAYHLFGDVQVVIFDAPYILQLLVCQLASAGLQLQPINFLCLRQRYSELKHQSDLTLTEACDSMGIEYDHLSADSLKRCILTNLLYLEFEHFESKLELQECKRKNLQHVLIPTNTKNIPHYDIHLRPKPF
ncbi:MAG: hypothetical protein HAW67_04705 [Endozoicomonadaceae bacterium]|nr:hypothetical protein [Endozoicomonadaceae bacterium]